MATTTRRLPITEQLGAICRGTEKILPDEAALLALMERADAENRPLRVKLGIDPTTHDLTLGHTIPLRNLRRFQDLGHQAVLVIGNYTATVGDPSGRSKARPPLTHEQVRANAETFREQAGKILDLEHAEVVWNSEWLSKLTLRELIRICGQVSVKRMLQGEYFGRRMEDPEQTIFMHEMFYPIMQGMDSVAIRADVELGGTDQEFNCLMGRDMQRQHGQPPQVVLTSPLLLGLTGPEKMSKSLGNYVGVAWPPQEKFNKLITLDDDHMPEYFQLLTDVPLDEIERKLADIRVGDMEPAQLKKELARTIVAELDGNEEAERAAQRYELGVRLRRGTSLDELVEELDRLGRSGLDVEYGEEAELPVAGDERTLSLVDVTVRLGYAKSRGEAKRLIEQGGVRVNGVTVRDTKYDRGVDDWQGKLLQVGRRPFVLIRVSIR